MNFGQRPCTIVQGVWPDFGATLKIRKKSNFDRNQLKLSKQHKYMYNVCVSEKIIKSIAHGFFRKLAPKPPIFIIFSDTY